MSVSHDSHSPHLVRRFGLLQATALNMSNMIGIGPFITIPLLMTALGGPQAMLGWVVALVIVVADGMVWSELGAAMPGSGGSYQYLREGFGRATWGRLMAFLFIWQFILSGPLEIASGYIGFSQLRPVHLAETCRRRQRSALPWLRAWRTSRCSIAGSTSIGALTVTLWVGTLLTTAVGHRQRGVSLRSRAALRLPAGRVHVLARASCSASAPLRVSASMTTWATTTSAISATK